MIIVFKNQRRKISEKVFINTKATADGMDTIFGHYMEVKDDKLSKFIAYDDTLSMFNAMKK